MKYLLRLWKFIQALTRDDAYEKYCEHHRAHHPGAELLDRKRFYLAEQERKWSGVKRCC